MPSALATLRQNAPRLTATQFLGFQPGSWVQYFDDTPANDPAKALSTPAFHPDTARRKQRDLCAVCFSLQAFGASRTKADLLCYRNLGADIDLVAAAERSSLSPEAVDRRKEAYLREVLLPFPLRPHWLTETGSGFHAVFRIQPQRVPAAVREAEAINRRLVRALRGDPNATLLTQLLRVPGTLQFKDPARPFFCRLLLDNSAAVVPYSLATVREALAGNKALLHTEEDGTASRATDKPVRTEPVSRWQAGLAGVAEGGRNTTAASLVGKIIGRLPEELWETAGWGGLKEWNTRNDGPLPERELLDVYESIARRERTRRAYRKNNPTPPAA